MKIIQSSDYRIYFDDVRMDPYIKNWSAACGLRASDAVATITMHRSKELNSWKGYLTQVRIFSRNIFSGKFAIVFEGEITNRNYADQRNDTGDLSFQCKGFYHWLNTPIPMMINDGESHDLMKRFEYAAHNIDVDAVADLFLTKEDLIMKPLIIQELIQSLFKKMNEGYYLYENSSFHWAKMEDRFKVMGDVIREFREAGYLDAFTFVKSTQIETFYVYLNQVLTQLMFEFYQDRDGALRIKNPSWKDEIMKVHVIDESVVQQISGFDDWENEPTRVLVVGGRQDTEIGMQSSGIGNVLNIPMGLYIGMPGEGQYIAQNVQLLMQEYGFDYKEDYFGGDGNDIFFDNISGGQYSVNSKFGPRDRNTLSQSSDVGNDFSVTYAHQDNYHFGVDYGMIYAKLYNIGLKGRVTLANYGSKTAGNWIIVKQTIFGEEYEFVYMHLSEIKVSVGDIVTPGQRLGTTGNTGTSTNPHLHLEIWKGAPRQTSGSIAVNPELFLPQLKNTFHQSNAEDTITNRNPIANLMNRNLANPNNVTARQLNEWINKKVGSRSNSKMRDMGGAFYEAGQVSGLDPVYIAAHAALETGWGTSAIVRDKNNFFGIRAFDHDPYNSASSWSTPREGIIEGANWIKRNYYDVGQNTLYTMRFSPSGTHNYATDRLWPNKIAATMEASGLIRSAEKTQISNPYLATPYSSTGGVGIRMSYTPATTTLRNNPVEWMNDLQKTMAGKKQEDPRPITYNSDSIVSLSRYIVPFTHNYLKPFIESQPNGVDKNLIGVMIEVASNWKEKQKNATRVGIMGVPVRYINDRLSENVEAMLDPEVNIQHGTELFLESYERFSNKVTFGLAGFYEGNFSAIEQAIRNAGAEDFSKAREHISTVTVLFVDKVIEKYVELFGGNYIKGDPHRTFVDFMNTQYKEELVESGDVKEYESAYKPVMSDEERLYKVNLKLSEQFLIKYSLSAGDGGVMNADLLVEMYAKYMMQLYRAESHGVNVTLSTCLPFLRPGFNSWLEPTRTNSVFYITRVQHQGSFNQGTFTTVTGGYVRDPNSYDDIEENIFVGKTNARAADFGEVVKKKDMNKLKKELEDMHNQNDQHIGDARSAPILGKLYSSASGELNEYSTMWNKEFSDVEIKNKIRALYSDAPQVVNDRKENLKNIMETTGEFLRKVLLETKF